MDPAPHPELLPRLVSVSEAIFLHWKLVNRTLPPERPLILMAETEIAGFRELLTLLGQLRTVAREVAEAERLPRDERRALQERMRLGWKVFGRLVRANYPRTLWERTVPPVPPARGEPWDFWLRFSAVRWVWKKMLARGLDPKHFAVVDPAVAPVAEWEASAAALLAALAHGTALGADTAFARADLEAAEAQLAAALTAYPAAVRSRLPAGHRLRASIPQIWPKPSPKTPSKS